jgi:bifunctional enzyme Fae/Hps
LFVIFSKMSLNRQPRLTTKNRYLQVAFDRDISYAGDILARLPKSERILVEVGTPLIKLYGRAAIAQIRAKCGNYLVADIKANDRGMREVDIASSGGADAATCMGNSSVETLDAFIAACRSRNLESMLDMMNVERPGKALGLLKELPDVVVLHRGFDEHENRSKQLPLIQISDLRDDYSMPISVAGGVDLSDAQKAVFNGANIVVLSDTLTPPGELPKIADEFVKTTH